MQFHLIGFFLLLLLLLLFLYKFFYYCIITLFYYLYCLCSSYLHCCTALFLLFKFVFVPFILFIYFVHLCYCTPKHTPKNKFLVQSIPNKSIRILIKTLPRSWSGADFLQAKIIKLNWVMHMYQRSG